MADVELKIKITKEDSALKELMSLLDKVGIKLSSGMSEGAKKGVDDLVAAVKKGAAETVAASETAAQKTNKAKLSEKEVAERVDAASAASAKRYAEMKASYEKLSLNQVRDEIMKHEEAVRTIRRGGVGETDAQIKKETQLRINATQVQLQLYRSLEKEKIGRTFSEQMERLKLEEKSNVQIKELLEKQASEFKTIQEKMTVTQNAEEKKRLSEELNNLKAENAAVKKEAEERKIEPAKKEKGEGGGINIAEVAGIGAAVKGLSTLVEKSTEVREANKAMLVSFGAGTEQAKKEAEEIGATMGKTGSETGKLMAQIHAATGANGEQLKQYTQAYIAAQDAGIKISAKSLQSEAGLQKLMTEGAPLVANAMKAAQEPAQQAALAQKNVEETAGELADTLLTGLAPVLQDLTPLINTLGGLANDILTPAMAALSFILHPLIDTLTTLKPILPYLAIMAGVVAAAIWVMNGAILTQNLLWLANPITWVIILIVALVVIVVQLVKHWDDVTAAMKKVFSAITDAGGAVLEFLGITGKASAETSKHTKAIDANREAAERQKKSIEDAKKALEDITKAADDYTDSLKKNADEADKDSKERQDNAIAAIRDIDEKLRDPAKRLAGDTAETLKKTRDLWIAHGKQAYADQQNLKKETDAASGTFIPDEKEKPKKVKDTTAKDDYEEIKNRLAKKYDVLKENAANTIASDKSLHAKELELAKEYDAELLAETDSYNIKHSTKKKDVANLERKITADNLAILKEFQSEELKQDDENTAEQLGILEKRGVQENLTERQIAQESYEIKLNALNEKLDAEKSFARDTEDVEKAVAELNRAHELDGLKQTEAIKKELQASADAEKLTGMKSQLEKLKSLSGNHAKEIAQQETDIAVAEENERSEKLKAERKDDITPEAGDSGALQKQKHALAESLEADHTGKMVAITQQGTDEQIKIQREQVAFMLGPFSKSFAKTTDKITGAIDKSIAKSIGQKTAFGQMAGEIVSGYVEMAAQAILTGNTQMLVDSAVATGKAALAAVSAVANAFASIPFPLDIVAAGAALAGVVLLVSKAKSIKLAEGGILTQPTFARGYEAGEAGHEAVIPLGSGRAQDALGIKDLGNKIDQSNQLMAKQNEHLSAIRNAGQQRAPFSPSSMYNVQGGINKAIAIVNRRVMG